MISTRWIERRKPHWTRLEALMNEASRRGVTRLAGGQLQELALLYRQIASDLSVVRDDAGEHRLAAYLNQLLGRAHNILYVGHRSRPGSIIHFYRHTYPRIFAATFRYSCAAFLMFCASAVVGFLVSLQEPGFQRQILGGEMIDTIEKREMWTHSILTVKPVASSAILTNNLGVAFTAFAAGMTAGIGTAYLMLLNGILFGVVTAACWRAGMLTDLFGFVAPHGVLELPAIFVAGGAGFVLARGMLFPGVLPRGESIRAAGSESVRLLFGTIPLLVVAGVIEGFFSPTELPNLIKFGFAGGLASLLALYLSAGRAAESSQQSTIADQQSSINPQSTIQNRQYQVFR